VRRTILLGFVGRSVALWLLTRLAVTTFVRVAPEGIPSSAAVVREPWLALQPPTAVLVALLVAVLVLLDVRALRERVFLANLGVSLGSVALLAFLCAASLEALVAAALAVRL
jgi:hypothetical protein